MAAPRTQAPWSSPASSAFSTGLKLFNSLTKSKVDFFPTNGRHVKWYICGPTVYDAAHMGHARAYITFDIVRRVMEDYFGYDIMYQMNITDVDDKIILRARQNHLQDRYAASVRDRFTAATVAELQTILDAFVVDKLLPRAAGAAAGTHEAPWRAVQELANLTTLLRENAKFKMNYDAAAVMASALVRATSELAVHSPLPHATADAVVEASRDILAPHLDAKDGSTVTDNSIFRQLAAYWEADFLKDMDTLNVRRADILTRVSEYIPEIVSYTEQIVKNGFGYESGGSVYFDARLFDDHQDHHYAKLEPRSAFNVQLVEEGEGAISLGLSDKRAPWDFALWKASRPGEPAWPSPWGKGRPGWHIECSAMASKLFGDKLDVHSGGIDLAFPHHDNELAQAEAYFCNDQWVNYFLHAGHLHIEGMKMSKSLKNFITIKDALQQYTPRQIRILFLLHNWAAILDYKRDSMEQAIVVETTLKNYFSTVLAVARAEKFETAVSGQALGPSELGLYSKLTATEQSVHAALCDNLDTPAAMQELLDLIRYSNTYINSRANGHCVALLLKGAKYIQRILTIFGVIEVRQEIGFGSSSTDAAGSGQLEERLTPYLQALSVFRDDVRKLARANADKKETLVLCDRLRDDVLPELGVRLEDREGAAALIKLEDREVLMRERQEKAQAEALRVQKKEDEKAKQEAKRLAKLEKGRTAPADLFKTGEYAGKYSQYDAQGIPTHEADGAEVSKKGRKNLEAAYATQVQLHQEFLASGAAASAPSQ